MIQALTRSKRIRTIAIGNKVFKTITARRDAAPYHADVGLHFTARREAAPYHANVGFRNPLVQDIAGRGRRPRRPVIKFDLHFTARRDTAPYHIDS